jgi:hypothetical protein
VSGSETVVPVTLPPEAIMTSLQEFAVTQLYVGLTREGGGFTEQLMPLLTVVWTYGLEEPPVYWTQEYADRTWSSGVVGIEGPPGEDSSLAPNQVRAWLEVNP